MSEWNEDKLNQELNNILEDAEGITQKENFEKNLNKKIDARIRKTVLSTLAVIATIALVIYLGINPIMRASYFNPASMNATEEKEYYNILKDYVETTLPFRELASLEVTDKGFGCYDLEMQIVDLTDRVYLGQANVWCELNRGVYENLQDVNSLFTHWMGRFDPKLKNQESIMEQIRELPASATLYLCISDSERKSFEKLQGIEEYGVFLEWIQVYQKDVEFHGGLQMHPHMVAEDNDARHDMTEADYIRVYQENLKRLVENQKLWEQFGLANGGNTSYIGKEILRETYAHSKFLTKIFSENYCIYGKRDEILKYLEDNQLNSVNIVNVLMW